MLDTIRRKLEQCEGQWMLPDDLDALLEIIGGALAEGPKYALGRSRTHWPECWRYASHHACAVAEVERLLKAVTRNGELQPNDLRYWAKRIQKFMRCGLLWYPPPDWLCGIADALEQTTDDEDRDAAETAALREDI